MVFLFLEKVPKFASELCTSGSIDNGTLKILRRSSSQLRVLRLSKFVLEALVISVLNISPPDNCQSKKVSTVPNLRSPFEAFSLAPSTLSKIHAIFVAEK